MIVKWSPSNGKDNSSGGYTGSTILDAYDIDTATGAANLLWRIDLGVNIRSGAHYTQFQVWDFDGDGSAEIMCKTADGSTTYQNVGGSLVETGYVGSGDAASLPTDTISAANDYRNASGYVLDGPEYLTIFDGETGSIIDTTDYIPARGTVSAWGDAYGNRVDRFLSSVAYLDGENPSAVFCRGYYSRTCLTAYDFVDTDQDGVGDKLQVRWEFDTNDYSVTDYGELEAQGNHGLSVNDIDDDGKDEIIYGALVIDHTGDIKYTTELGHGDAMHVSNWVPSNYGLEVFSVHEHTGVAYQVEIHDAETGTVLWGYPTGVDTGRGAAAAIVDGKTSFMSEAVVAQTLVSVKSVRDFELSIVEDTPIVEGGTVVSLLPTQLDVIDSNDNITKADVTWDVSNVDITVPGDYTVTAAVSGYSGIISKTLTVVANTITGYGFDGYTQTSETEPYYTYNTIQNTKTLSLPTATIFHFANVINEPLKPNKKCLKSLETLDLKHF